MQVIIYLIITCSILTTYIKPITILGTKAKPESELKTSFGLKKPPGSGITSGPSLKRDRDQMAGSSSGIVQAAKRSRLGSGALQTLGRSSDTLENKFAPAVHLYEDIAIEGIKCIFIVFIILFLR